MPDHADLKKVIPAATNASIAIQNAADMHDNGGSTNPPFSDRYSKPSSFVSVKPSLPQPIRALVIRRVNLFMSEREPSVPERHLFEQPTCAADAL